MREVTSVSVQQQSGVRRAVYWPIPLARAIVLIATALVITFSQDHSATLGLTVFGAFAIVTAVIFAIAGILIHRGAERVIVLLQALVSVVAGVLALAISGGGLPFFLYLVSVWAAITGFLELFLGLRARRTPPSRDWIFVGALTVLFAVVVLILPPDLNDEFTGTGGVSGVLTAAIIAVGALGAYAAIAGVYLAIGALSMKWAGPEPAAVTEHEGHTA
jgi:uncharacterized membrane protein HdeD (DUF308 family)